ncbi:MAG: MGMT family protein [Elusimicrobia bacterium]|nr:MGMT family protein [Elusimicrobiota bacterium]
MNKIPEAIRKALKSSDRYPAVFREIWGACARIPKGRVATYGSLARSIGRPRAARVVAMAMARNPFAPDIPCHRVVRSDGSLGGYSASGGVGAKRRLLEREGVLFGDRGGVAKACLLETA